MTDEPHRQPSPSIRTATRADIDAIALIEALSFHSIDEIFTPKQVSRLIRSPKAIVLVAQRHGDILGWAAALHRRTQRGITGRIYSIAVHPHFRGQRVGDALACALLDSLQDCNCTRIYLEVRTDNDPAIRLYRRLGFTIARTLPDYYSSGIHALSMRMDIADRPPTPFADSVFVFSTR